MQFNQNIKQKQAIDIAKRLKIIPHFNFLHFIYSYVFHFSINLLNIYIRTRTVAMPLENQKIARILC